MSTLPAWLHEPGLMRFFAALQSAGGEARVVGGAVRDFLHTHADAKTDIDLATTLRPEQVIAVATTLSFKTIPTGIAHGTVTVLLPERAVEVTTLRRDVTTDGRHATVAFTDDWQADAARRDFTINALYMDAHGKISDYFGGQEDLHAQRVRFIGDASTRIDEDGLRMLRFFRFLASHGTAPADAQAIAAITQRTQAIDALSGERITTEMKKMLHVRDNLYALQQMQHCGLYPKLVNSAVSLDVYEKLLHCEKQHAYAPHPLLRLTALLPSSQRLTAARWIGARWKLSREEQDHLTFFAQGLGDITTASLKELLRRHSRDILAGALLLTEADSSITRADATSFHALIRRWEIPNFPVAASHLMERGFSPGKPLGDCLRMLEEAWVKSDYQLTRDALLNQLPKK